MDISEGELNELEADIEGEQDEEAFEPSDRSSSLDVLSPTKRRRRSVSQRVRRGREQQRRLPQRNADFYEEEDSKGKGEKNDELDSDELPADINRFIGRNDSSSSSSPLSLTLSESPRRRSVSPVEMLEQRRVVAVSKHPADVHFVGDEVESFGRKNSCGFAVRCWRSMRISASA